jgi:elongation factor 1-alpha
MMSQAVTDNLAQQEITSLVLPNPDITEIRIGIMGNVDSGKSTLTGVLTKDVLDDGRGRARTLVMKHKHELATGRTSCVTHHYTRTKIKAENGKEGERHITYIDLAGHEK